MKWPVSGIAGFFFRMDTQAKAEVSTTKTFILVRMQKKKPVISLVIREKEQFLLQ
jgi:hypothetical protein